MKKAREGSLMIEGFDLHSSTKCFSCAIFSSSISLDRSIDRFSPPRFEKLGAFGCHYCCSGCGLQFALSFLLWIQFIDGSGIGFASTVISIKPFRFRSAVGPTVRFLPFLSFAVFDLSLKSSLGFIDTSKAYFLYRIEDCVRR